MRAAVLCGLLLLISCGKKDEGGGGGSGGKKDEREEPASFSADNFGKTRDWLRGRTRRLEEVRAGKNEIADRNALQAARDELKPHIGKAISWRLKIDRVENGTVFFADELLSSSREVKVWFEVRGGPAGQGYGSQVPTGPALTQAVAGQLRKGDTLLVNGRITRFELDGVATDLYFMAFLKDVSTTP